MPSSLSRIIVTDDRNPTADETLLRACRCAEIADRLKASDVVLLDLRNVTPICDFFVIASGASTRLMRAVAEEIHKFVKADEQPTRGFEGSHDDRWILADYGDIVLHVFHPEARELYDLEGLWADARRVDWRKELGLPAAADA